MWLSKPWASLETRHWAVDMVRAAGRRTFRRLPQRQQGDLVLRRCSIRKPCHASLPRRQIQKALDIVSAGDISARDFVNREEPLSNLLEVMRHLMSHNGHLKTAIFP
jgi:threonine dehydrogenase-like Zn-dependent dehydrogenase